jgi:hypothetical protein
MTATGPSKYWPIDVYVTFKRQSNAYLTRNAPDIIQIISIYVWVELYVISSAKTENQ